MNHNPIDNSIFSYRIKPPIYILEGSIQTTEIFHKNYLNTWKLKKETHYSILIFKLNKITKLV